MSSRRWYMLFLMQSLALHSLLLSQDAAESCIRAKISSTKRESCSHPLKKSSSEKRPRMRRKKGGNSWVGNFFGDAMQDVFVLNRNLFLWNSFKVISSAFPLFIGARMIDERLQNCFYDSVHHRNINQLPDWFYTITEVGTVVPVVFLGLDGLLSKNLDKFYTAKILLVGVPFIIWTKTLIKTMKFEACLRPWNENFSCEDRSYGGFPSGHMAQVMYTAVLFGTRYGPNYALPLGALATFLAVTFISCNRHYTSQIVAGAAFGTLYAMAANTLVDSKLTDTVKLGLRVDERGAPNLSLAFKF